MVRAIEPVLLTSNVFWLKVGASTVRLLMTIVLGKLLAVVESISTVFWRFWWGRGMDTLVIRIDDGATDGGLVIDQSNPVSHLNVPALVSIQESTVNALAVGINAEPQMIPSRIAIRVVRNLDH